MSKFLKSLTDGSLRCRYCGDRKCNCMENGSTHIGIIFTKEYDYAWWTKLRKQVLPNGKKIPSGYILSVPKKRVLGVDAVLKTMLIDNDYLNRLVFQE